ncbi:MAG: succinyldiaminopimelate transaminase [Thiotrichales bacterium]|nr:succinyldiaminopimelate transaminase [Thiotrichales bacterium]
MNPGLGQLHPYPFEKLATLKAGGTGAANQSHIDLSIGEPKHKTPQFILDELNRHLHLCAGYPKTRGTDALRDSIRQWLCRRFQLPDDSIDAEQHILPVNGTREALFAFAQCVIAAGENQAVILPNPFYQIYEGATLLAGAEPVYLACLRENNFQPDLADLGKTDLNRCRLMYLCTPGNPTGAVIEGSIIRELLEMADRHDFILAADECYSEIYTDEDSPPKGLLQYAMELGRTGFERCIVFHSLSKRSNVPGMRSGFVAGDAGLIRDFLRYRTYHGCAMAGYTQQASLLAWSDEEHVIENRRLYREKFDSALGILQPVLEVDRPDAGFYLWPELPVDDEQFSRDLYTQKNVTLLPGVYLSRTINGKNPGSRHVRIALVASRAECDDAARRMVELLSNY